jgi:hypothetical protein
MLHSIDNFQGLYPGCQQLFLTRKIAVFFINISPLSTRNFCQKNQPLTFKVIFTINGQLLSVYNPTGRSSTYIFQRLLGKEQMSNFNFQRLFLPIQRIKSTKVAY